MNNEAKENRQSGKCHPDIYKHCNYQQRWKDCTDHPVWGTMLSTSLCKLNSLWLYTLYLHLPSLNIFHLAANFTIQAVVCCTWARIFYTYFGGIQFKQVHAQDVEKHWRPFKQNRSYIRPQCNNVNTKQLNYLYKFIQNGLYEQNRKN